MLNQWGLAALYTPERASAARTRLFKLIYKRSAVGTPANRSSAAPHLILIKKNDHTSGIRTGTVNVSVFGVLEEAEFCRKYAAVFVTHKTQRFNGFYSLFLFSVVKAESPKFD
jgi:hypothetical protein